MKKIAYFLIAVAVVILASTPEVLARGGGGGGRGGGGGGGRGGGGGGGASRSPSMSRPSTPAARPSTPSARPSAPAARPSQPAASRPTTRPSTGGTRPAAGARPSQGQLEGFLDVKQPGASKQPGTRPSTGAGGAAGEFLQNQPSAGQRPAATGKGVAAKSAAGKRPGAGQLAGNRPERVKDRQQLTDNRHQRRDEVRNQFNDNHPRFDFWKGNPNAARWRWNRPYRWATWGLVAGWFPGKWTEESYYSYGDTIYYEGDQVYYGDEAVASSEEYAQQAQTIATSATKPAADAEWLPLGVFAMTQDGQSSGPAPTIFLQLTVSKEGVIAGTVTNTETDKVQPIEGMIDMETQRSAWGIAGKKSPIMETGLANLTKDETPVLLHFADGQTQQWLLVRMEEPKEEAGQN